MIGRVIRVAVIAVALLMAALLVPDIEIEWADDGVGIGLTLLVLALAFGLVNAFIRPIARLVSLPLNIATLGLFSVVLNAALLLGVAFLVDLVWGPLIVIGGYPPDLGIEAVASAALGSVIISAVSTGLLVLIPES
jgi:putative membrane protein